MRKKVDVPVALLETVGHDLNVPCCEVILMTVPVETSVEEFWGQLAGTLKERGRNLVELTFKGARLVGDAAISRYINVDNVPAIQAPRFAATYDAGHDPSLQIRVLNLQGKRITITCRGELCTHRKSYTIYHVKQLIREKTGDMPERFNLMLNAIMLGDKAKILDCNIQPDSIVFMEPRRTGTLAEIAYTFGLGTQPLQPEANEQTTPWWQKLAPGLNLDGICGNRRCVAYSQKVVDYKGMTSFAPVPGSAHCPSCRHQFLPTAVHPVNCVWTLDEIRNRKGGGLYVLAYDWMDSDQVGRHAIQEHLLEKLTFTARPGYMLRLQGLQPCRICWDLGGGDKDYTVCRQIGHFFHVNCLQAWRQSMSTVVGRGCPCCRVIVEGI